MGIVLLTEKKVLQNRTELPIGALRCDVNVSHVAISEFGGKRVGVDRNAGNHFAGGRAPPGSPST